jgi:hypothetical protein
MSGSQARSTIRRPGISEKQESWILRLVDQAGTRGVDTLTYHGGTITTDPNTGQRHIEGLSGGWNGTASPCIDDLKNRNYRRPGDTTNRPAIAPTARTNSPAALAGRRGVTPAERRSGDTEGAAARFRANAPSAQRFTPTAEQAHIITLAATPDEHGVYRNQIVEAGAGTGKTSLLLELCRAMPTRRGLYTTFNKAIVVEGDSKFPKRLPGGGGVQARTMHSLAWHATDQQLIDRLKKSYRIHPDRVAERLGIQPLAVPDPLGGTKPHRLKAGVLASIVMGAILRFCQSADPEPARRHFGRQEGLDPDGVWDNHNTVFTYLERYLPVVWADLCDVNGFFPYVPAHYLKCQPAGTLVTRVVRKGGNNKHTGECWDTEWEQTPIEDIIPGDEVVSWNGTFKSGHIRKTGRPVTHAGSRHYDGALVTVATPTGSSSSYTHDHICIARIPERLAGGNHIVYMMRRGNDYRIGRTPWTFKTSRNTVFGPVNRAWTQGADALWILSVHETDRDAALAEALAQHEFNIPGWQFKSTNEFIPVDQFWSKVGGNWAQAERCLSVHGRDVTYPFWEKGGFMSRARPAEVRACNLLDGMEVCEVASITPRHNGRGRYLYANPGSGAWQPVEVTRAPYSGAVYSIEVDTDHTYVADGIVTHNCWSLTDPILPFDYIMIDEGQDMAPVMLAVVEVNMKAGKQIILVGDSYQAINEWTGAVDALTRLPIESSARLTRSFRFGHTGAAGANWILERLGNFRLVGNPNVETVVGPATGPVRCTLYRSNAATVAGYMEDLDAGGRPFLMGGGDDFKKFCRSARVLQLVDKRRSTDESVERVTARLAQVSAAEKQAVRDQLAALKAEATKLADEAASLEKDQTRPHPDLACFETWTDVRVFVNEYDEGKEIKLQVGLVDRFGAMEIVRALDTMPKDEGDATSVHSTAHKVKGCEWDTVQLADDFPDEIDDLDPQELKLLYVAFTRGKLLIDPTRVGCLQGLVDALRAAPASDPVAGAAASPTGGGRNT